MRAVSLTLIVISLIIIAISKNMNIDTDSLSNLTTLIVVVVSAFASSALLRNLEKMKLTRNYIISGIVGIIAGVLYYTWISVHLDATLDWLKNYGIYILLLIILFSAIALYLSNPPEEIVSTPDNSPENAESDQM